MAPNELTTVIYIYRSTEHDASAFGETYMPRASQPAGLEQSYGQEIQGQASHQEETGCQEEKVTHFHTVSPDAKLRRGNSPVRFISVPQKLRQGQVWKHGDEFIRIVRLERLEVGYKTFKNLKTGEGKHHHTSKKDFCRLLKACRLLAPKAPAPISLPEASPGPKGA